MQEEIKKRAADLLANLKVDEKRKSAREIEAESMKPDFWKDHEAAGKKMIELSNLQKEIEQAETLSELVSSGKYEEAEKLIEELELFIYLSGKYDKSNAILSIHAGQGGLDAMDWAMMLFRMYTRYFERQGWKVEVIEESVGDEAGIKDVTLVVEGPHAYGKLKAESGTHRLVRLSPFNADQLRHTSFALVEVLPQIEEDPDINIKEDDLEWEFYRASSHGGQNVQKVSSAVRLKHKPSGIVVTCQTERYQGQNREYALKHLKSKLWAKRQEEIKTKEKNLKGDYVPASWGNQIRSYVLHPYQMVKDLRTQVETSNTDGVLDGGIDEFIEAGLRTL